MKLKDIDVRKLKGVALDYAVAKIAYGVNAKVVDGVVFAVGGEYIPTKNWIQCGRLIDHFKIDLGFDVAEENEPYYAIYFDEVVSGGSYQEAVCRAIVNIHGNFDLNIPDGLLKE